MDVSHIFANTAITMERNCSMGGKKTAANLKAHLRKRAEQRYGLSLGKEAVREINSKIQNNQAEFVERQSYSRSLWKVEHGGQVLNVVYNNNLHTACTVLPRNATQFQVKPPVAPEPQPLIQQKPWDLQDAWYKHIWGDGTPQ
jgi:hypothetical protein